PASAWLPAWRRHSRRCSAARTWCAFTMSRRPSMRWRFGAQPACRDRGQSRIDSSSIRTMSRTYFGTDGVRGTVGQSPITPDFMLGLGHAVGRVLKRSEARPTVLIGKDTRISGYMIESALEAGFASAGVDVVLTGPLPTPGV